MAPVPAASTQGFRELAARALGELDRRDQEVEGLRDDLLGIEREDLHNVPPDELEQRRQVALAALGDRVMDGPSSPYSSALGGIELDVELAPRGLFVPSEARPSWVPSDRRYSLEWTDPEAPSGLAQSERASAATGRVHVVNLALSTASTGRGHAQAGVGIAVRPEHALSRLTLRPELTYRWRYLLDTPVPGPNQAWSRVSTRGQLRLIAQRQDPVSGHFETLLRRHVDLWSASSLQGSARYENDDSGSYPSTDPGLSLIGSSGSSYALWVVASVYIDKQDPDLANPSLCQASLDVDVPAMWLDEVSLS